MKFKTTIVMAATLAAMSLTATSALAKVSADEAAKLGTTLTPIGAEQAGNADGTIPAWTGGMTTAPAGYQGEGTTRIDPFADEKPLFTITASNYKDYADKLTEGHKALFEKYPDTYTMPVYKTHRTAAAPQAVYDNTKINAENAELTADGNGVLNAFGGIPFPIPKNGKEVIWNHNLRWSGQGDMVSMSNATIFPNGQVRLGGATMWQSYPYYDFTTNISSFNGNVLQVLGQFDLPVRRKGEVILLRDAVNASKTPRQAWQYIPGQRRVRRAPTIAFDTPNPQYAGQTVYDDAYMFNGSPERFDWKLVGKKELYIAYNSNGFLASAETANGELESMLTPNHLSTENQRNELHRVWVVEATLAEGKRHVYGKRTMYIDEDTWNVVATDIYDGRGELWRAGFAQMLNAYDVPLSTIRAYYHVDLQNGVYAVNEVDREPKKFYEGEADKFFTPAQVRKLSKR